MESITLRRNRSRHLGNGVAWARLDDGTVTMFLQDEVAFFPNGIWQVPLQMIWPREQLYVHGGEWERRS